MSQPTRDEWKQIGVEMAAEVDLARIAPDVTILPGCRVSGTRTSIGPGSVLGGEGPVVLENCQLGRNIELKGGYFSGAVFFDGANMGSGAHVRPGTILEEEANGAHSVGLKQTILLPFVTLGSLINFCDVLMAGGTSRKNHSEVGSSYIHFNFTPHQDKATASLVGDVVDGVFLDRSPIFLGGQGGLAGPARIAYGTVIAAGGICRKDVLEENQLHVAETPEAGTRPYVCGVYRKMDRLVANNLAYIGNVAAMRAWYRCVRPRFVRDTFDQACLDGGLENLGLVLAERIKRLGELAGKMAFSIRQLETQDNLPAGVIASQKRFQAAWPAIEAGLKSIEAEPPAGFVDQILPGVSYVKTIQSLTPERRREGRAWLQSMVDAAVALFPL